MTTDIRQKLYERLTHDNQARFSKPEAGTCLRDVQYVIKYYGNIYTRGSILVARADMTNNLGGSREGKGSEDDWGKTENKEEKDDYSIRESVFEGDGTSEYIRGTILEAADTEEGSAKQFEGDMSRSQTMLAEKIADSSLPEIVYYMNPRNYDLVDWVFASGFLMVIVSAVVMFTTSNINIAVVALVAMFLSFCAMLLCASIEDILKGSVRKIRRYRWEEGEEGFEDGEAFEDRQ